MIRESQKEIKRGKEYKNSKRLNKYANQKGNRFGVSLKDFAKSYKNLLKNRLFISSLMNDDRLLELAFYCLDIENDHKIYNKVYYIKHLDKITTLNSINYNNNLIIWKCSFCESDIIVDISSKINHKDLFCDKCKPEGIVRIIDERVTRNFSKLNNYIVDKINTDFTVLSDKMQL